MKTRKRGVTGLANRATIKYKLFYNISSTYLLRAIHKYYTTAFSSRRPPKFQYEHLIPIAAASRHLVGMADDRSLHQSLVIVPGKATASCMGQR